MGVALRSAAAAISALTMLSSCHQNPRGPEMGGYSVGRSPVRMSAEEAAQMRKYEEIAISRNPTGTYAKHEAPCRAGFAEKREVMGGHVAEQGAGSIVDVCVPNP